MPCTPFVKSFGQIFAILKGKSPTGNSPSDFFVFEILLPAGRRSSGKRSFGRIRIIFITK